jgi:tRNA modification GTPase
MATTNPSNAGDTIVALGSAVGPAARMIVRTSGPASLAIAASLDGTVPADAAAAGVSRRTLRFGGLAVPAWVYRFVSPRSYSGEDAAEYHLPGNPLLARKLLEAIVARGARPATAGEFTSRAFFNGRIDLAEAEAVAATIAAHSDRELRAARQLMGGELARRLRPAMDALADALALVEVGIDFSDEDVTFLPADALRERLASLRGLLRSLLESSARFERLSHEPTVVLVGWPNAGKSSLLNALAGVERAVVSDVAGTTRDALSARVMLTRGTVQMIDVAGLEASALDLDRAAAPPAAHPMGAIERSMQAAALRAIAQADVVVLVRDLADGRPDVPLDRTPDLVVRTKRDLHPDPPGDDASLVVSVRTGEGLERLRAMLDGRCFGSAGVSEALALTSRHVQAIHDTLDTLGRADAVADGPAELVALELREALDQLGSVLGLISPDDLLGRVFSRFCIGK